MQIIGEDKYYTLDEIRLELDNKGIKQKHVSTLQAFVKRNKTESILAGNPKIHYYSEQDRNKIIRYYLLCQKRKALVGMIKATKEEIDKLLKRRG